MFPERANISLAQVRSRQHIVHAHLGARRRPHPRLRLGRLRGGGGGGAAAPHRPQGDGDAAGRRSADRMARARRPRADDRAGGVRVSKAGSIRRCSPPPEPRDERRGRHLRLPAQCLRVGSHPPRGGSGRRCRRDRGQHLRGDRARRCGSRARRSASSSASVPMRTSWSPAAPRRPSRTPSSTCRRSRSCSATRRSSAPSSGARIASCWRGRRSGSTATKRSAVNDIMAVTETAAHLVDGLEGRARAFVQVQNGCDHRCTFCIIPYGRGNSRSVPMGEVVAQVRRLAARGYREVVLTGVDLTGYGSNLPGAAEARHAGEADPQACSGARAAAALVDQFGRGRPRLARCLRRRRAADAASAPFAAGRRRSDPQAHEAAPSRAPTPSPSAIRCGGCGRTWCSAPTSSPASRPRPRRCSARSLDLVDRMRAHPSPRVPVLAASRHAGRPHAAGRRARPSRSAPGGCARRARRRCARHLDAQVGAQRIACWPSQRATWPHRAFRAGAACGCRAIRA